MTTDPAGVAEPRELMASLIETRALDAVVWPLSRLEATDRIQITPGSGELRVNLVRPGWAPSLTSLLVRFDVDGAPRFGALMVPSDLEVTVTEAMRQVRVLCRFCERPALYIFDAADTAIPDTVICEDCDQRITVEVRAEAEPPIQEGAPTP